MKTPEDEFNEIIDAIEFRAMVSDGPVTPTLQAATEQELSRLWELVNEISPKRKALTRKAMKIETASNEEVREYLRIEGLDPDQIAREGSVFVKTLTEKIQIEKMLMEVSMRCNLAMPTSDQQMKWFDEGVAVDKSGDFLNRLFRLLKIDQVI